MSPSKRVVVLLFTGAFAMAACGSGDSGSGNDDLVGTWMAGPTSYIQFDEDGTYGISTSLAGLESPIEQGQFAVEGTLVTFTSSEQSEVCDTGDRGSYETEGLGEDQIRQVLVEDECGRRSQSSITMERVAPQAG